MVGVRVVFGVVVSPGFGASILVIMKLVLGSSAMEPPEAHIHHLGPAGDNRFVGDTCGSGVISLDRAFWLWPSHGNESLPVGDHFPCRAKCHQKLVVNRSGILIEERANDFLNATFTVFVKELGSVCFWGELGLSTIGDWQHLYGERRFLIRRACLNLMRRFSM